MKKLYQYGYDHWSKSLCDLSPPSVVIPLTDEWRLYLDHLYAVSQGVGRQDYPTMSQVRASLYTAVGKALETVPCAFPKLGPAGISPVRPIDTAHDAVRCVAVTSSCHRVLRLAHRDKMPLAMVLRKWMVIAAHEEFRLYVRDGKVAGVCQYDVDRCFPQIEVMRFCIIDLLRHWATEQMIPAIADYLPDVNVDVVCDTRNGAVTLLDIDPPNDVGRDRLYGPGELVGQDFDFRYVRNV